MSVVSSSSGRGSVLYISSQCWDSFFFFWFELCILSYLLLVYVCDCPTVSGKYCVLEPSLDLVIVLPLFLEDFWAWSRGGEEEGCGSMPRLGLITSQSLILRTILKSSASPLNSLGTRVKNSSTPHGRAYELPMQPHTGEGLWAPYAGCRYFSSGPTHFDSCSSVVSFEIRKCKAPSFPHNCFDCLDFLLALYKMIISAFIQLSTEILMLIVTTLNL